MNFSRFFFFPDVLIKAIWQSCVDIAWALTNFIMPHERQCVIFHMIPYNLHDTIVAVYDHWNRQVENGVRIHIEVFDNVVATLYDLKYLVAYDSSDFIPDIYDGVLLHLDVFFRRYGVVDSTFASDPVHVMDFPVNETEMTETRDDDSITTEEEEDLVILSHIWHIECSGLSDDDDSDYIPPLY